MVMESNDNLVHLAGHVGDHEGHEDHVPLPSSVAVAGEGTGFEYLYRRGDLLTTHADAERVGAGLRTTVGKSVEREVHKELSLVRYRLPHGVDIPRAVREIRGGPGEQPITVAPNHVLFFPSHIKWVAGAAPPVPAPARDAPCGDNLPGSGVKVGVVDTGVVSS